MIADDEESKERTKQWLEHVLQTYYTYLGRRSNCEGPPEMPDPNNQDDLVNVEVTDFDIGPGLKGEGKILTLSDLISLLVRFKVNGSDEVKTENFIIKIPPNDKADRALAQMAQVDKREIHFYTEALPDLEYWCKTQNVDMKINVPRCFFAKYHKTEPQVEEGGDDDDESAKLSDAESVLVLEDMRAKGYRMRDFKGGLCLDEAFAALREIATVHALSWAMQEETSVALDDKWELAYRSQKSAPAYRVMIEQGYPVLATFLESQKPDGPEILDKLQELHPKAGELLCELLDTPPPPAPSCLIHMDFWCNNLLFRRRTPPDGTTTAAITPENGNVTNGRSTHAGQTSSLDDDEDWNSVECSIIDWQMMSIGRPTHDVALLILSSLTPDERRAHTDALLKYYWKAFQNVISKLHLELPFDFGVIENEYKKSQLLALLLVIGSIDLAVETPVTKNRLMEALRDMVKEELI